jgi:Ca2+-binding EF-hand superfamily protein
LKTLKEKVDNGEEISTEETTDIAEKWMEFADVDGNGTIDQAEFTEFIYKLDDNIEESKAIEIFTAQDGEGNGQLPVSSFANALFESLKLMKPEEGEEEN